MDTPHVTNVSRVSERQILLYKADDLSTSVCTVGLDVSPAILQIHIDHDSGTLFLTGRVSILLFEGFNNSCNI